MERKGKEIRGLAITPEDVTSLLQRILRISFVFFILFSTAFEARVVVVVVDEYAAPASREEDERVVSEGNEERTATTIVQR